MEAVYASASRSLRPFMTSLQTSDPKASPCHTSARLYVHPSMVDEPQLLTLLYSHNTHAQFGMDGVTEENPENMKRKYRSQHARYARIFRYPSVALEILAIEVERIESKLKTRCVGSLMVSGVITLILFFLFPY